MKHLTIRSIFVICFTMIINQVQAQVTIGSDKAAAKAALLELKTKDADPSTNETTGTGGGGLGLPRVKLENKKNLMPFIPDDANFQGNVDKIKDAHVGLTVYNLTSNLSTEDNTDKRFQPGIYVWDGTQWNFIYEGMGQRYFFIPSANLPLADAFGNILPAGSTFDLYSTIYKAQFSKAGNNTFVSSNPTLNFVPSPMDTGLYDATDLDYVITYYDKSVIKINSISVSGVMSYDVLSLDTTPASFINVVFIIKEDKLK